MFSETLLIISIILNIFLAILLFFKSAINNILLEWWKEKKALSECFENNLLKTIIPKNITLTEAEFYRRPSVLIDASAKGSAAYMKLAKEIIDNNQ